MDLTDERPVITVMPPWQDEPRSYRWRCYACDTYCERTYGREQDAKASATRHMRKCVP